jgi:hypothetical protein
MKKLTKEQMRSLRVFNPWEFVGPNGFYLMFVPWSNPGRCGWGLYGRGIRDEGTHAAGRMVPTSTGGRDRPESFRGKIEPILKENGHDWPDEWVRFMGEWMPKAIYTARMKELCARYAAGENPQESTQ